MPEENENATEVIKPQEETVVETKDPVATEVDPVKEESTKESTDPKEVVETEEVIEPEKNEPNEEVAGLKAEIAKLQSQLATANENSKSINELNQTKTLLTEQKGLVEEYEGVLNGIIDTKLKDLPDNLKELVPTNLGLKEKLDWLNKAEKTGIFKPANPDIEIGKPLNPNSSKQTVDTSQLSASALMSMAYGSSKNRNKR